MSVFKLAQWCRVGMSVLSILRYKVHIAEIKAVLGLVVWYVVLWCCGRWLLWLRTQKGRDGLDNLRQISLGPWRAGIQYRLLLVGSSPPAWSFSASVSGCCGLSALSGQTSLGGQNWQILSCLGRPPSRSGSATSSTRFCSRHWILLLKTVQVIFLSNNIFL